MTAENISWSNLHERMLPTQWGLNLQPSDHQLDVHLLEPPRPAIEEGYPANYFSYFSTKTYSFGSSLEASYQSTPNRYTCLFYKYKQTIQNALILYEITIQLQC